MRSSVSHQFRFVSLYERRRKQDEGETMVSITANHITLIICVMSTVSRKGNVFHFTSMSKWISDKIITREED